MTTNQHRVASTQATKPGRSGGNAWLIRARGSHGGRCSGQAPARSSSPSRCRPGKAPAQGGKKPFEGVTLNISCWSATYPKLIADYLPEFTEKTGIKVNYDTPGFPVYNQRADLELSTKGSGFDVLNVTFIYTSRWIGAGWLTPLDPFIKDPNKTPADWDFADFLPGSVQPMSDKAGAVYGIPWISDVLMAAVLPLRHPQGQRASACPTRFDELDKAMQVVNKKEGVAGFSIENHWGWIFIPLPAGLRRQRVPQSARRPDADARHPRGGGGRRDSSPS